MMMTDLRHMTNPHDHWFISDPAMTKGLPCEHDPICLSVCLAHSPICLSAGLSVCALLSLSIHLFICCPWRMTYVAQS